MQPQRWTAYAETGCLAIFLAWLIWLPLPFGSVIERARLPLVAVPLGLCALAALIRLIATRDRTNIALPTRAWLIWSNGALLFLATAALQLVPLPPSLLGFVSAESLRIWNGAARVAALAGVTTSTHHPITVDPQLTGFELLRLCALFATFLVAALLIRTHGRRRALAIALCLGAAFQAIYGFREAALQRYEIWGWVNKLIFHRVTGTFVNPNHFGHYVAIVLPMALFLLAVDWHDSGSRDTPILRRLAFLFERSAIRTIFAAISALCCTAALLLSQSRGAMVAAAAGLLFTIALLPGRRVMRVAFAAIGGLAIVAALVLFLGPERTLHRFVPTEIEVNALEGRRIAVRAAVAIWHRFSLFGSGLGTFERVVAMDQKEGLELTYHHAHNDYLELAATAGTVGAVIALVAFAGGYVWLLRMTFGAASRELSWRRRAFQAAALASITIAAVHALFDFNFYIPANPATLVAMAGAAVASVVRDRRADHDKRTRR
ncbi:MAG TPA: O-antigen ligase family protein [Thermoanaerobaculia bacterium]|nr:O-antigen ligase family protein [Thermoanaerobaculia bacterium]